MGLIVNNGLLDSLQPLSGSLVAGSLQLTIRLYTNDPTITNDMDEGDFTEATFDGYNPVLMSGWTDFAPAAGNEVDMSSNVNLFGATSGATPQDCYGWYITDQLGGVYAAERFASAPLNIGGGTPSVTIQVRVFGRAAA